MKTLLASTALLLALSAPALAQSNNPPTDPQNMQPSVASPLTPRSSEYSAKPSTTRRHVRRKRRGSTAIETQDFGRPTRK